MIRRSYLVVAVVGAAIAWLMYARSDSTSRLDPIMVQEGSVVVVNRSDREWRAVVITVNDHFHGGARSLAPGSRLSAPLSQFATSHGQRYDRGRQSVVKVELKATDDVGQPVRLEWNGRRAP
jgi:hypothetical protein